MPGEEELRKRVVALEEVDANGVVDEAREWILTRGRV